VKSIRVFLVAVILAVIVLFNFLAALKGYTSSMQEADRLFDRQLRETAALIANLHTESTAFNIDHNSTLAFQVWQDGRLVASSFNAPETTIASLTPGFDFSNFDGYRWRTVSYFDSARRYWVVAAERMDLRYTLAENVILEAIFPILLGLPLVGLLIWLIVSRGLRPLRKLAQELGNKRPEDLSPLSHDSASQELRQIVTSSNTLLGRLERSLLRERQFASDAAHELRTPISTLKVQLHNMKKRAPDNDPGVRDLQITSERLEHIVEQILALYRSSPDQFNASMVPIDLCAEAREVLAEEHYRFETKNQEIEFKGERAVVQGDEFALKTLLQNLLSNAAKYTPAGGKVHVSVSTTDGTAVLQVEDSGIGIPEEQRAAVFERFYRVGGDRHATGEPGCGLGLAIVQRIAELHGATISLHSSGFESGTAVRVEFPFSGAAS
jgi:two-component system sensor histidine kinase QseC